MCPTKQRKVKDSRKHLQLRAQLEVDPKLLELVTAYFKPVDTEVKYDFRMSQQQSKELVDQYGLDKVIDAINHAITVLEMPVPLPPRDIETRDSDFANLKKIRVKDVVRYRNYQHLFPYRYKLDDVIFGMVTTGNKSSSYFNEGPRSDLMSKNGNISGLWNDVAKRRPLSTLSNLA